MPKVAVATTNPSSIDLEYDTFGDPGDPALLLIMGFTAQLTGWDEALCNQLAEQGRYVIRYDNRDCGLSTKLDGVAVDTGAVMVAALAGVELPPVPYTLVDMGNDATGLLDHLDIERAHLVGASMGGMIAQTVAIEHPQRVLSLTSIMSTTGDPAVGRSTPEAITALLTPPPADRDAYIDGSSRWATWASKRYVDHRALRDRAAREYDRSFYPEGAPRQLAAIYASGERTEALRLLDIPTLVIHGRDDTLITQSGGERTAELIPGARLLLLDDMGHDLPTPIWPVLVDAIIAHTRSDRTGSRRPQVARR
ncbi:MAG: alpha/beta hydrolase [Acidimicrobiia bacterium]|nr:alpha/beta hydrolase [Acidimicrobiia bacterium]